MPNLDLIDIDDGGGGGGGGGTFPPAAPTGGSALFISDSSVTLTWTAVAGALEYRINYGLTIVSNILSNSYTVVGLSPNTSYNFTVQVQTAAGWSSPSSPISVTTAPVDIIGGGGGPTGGSGTDKLGSFIFMTEYTVPSGNSGSVEIKYRRGKMSTGLYPEVITKTVTKETLINNFDLDPSFEGTKVFNPKEYGL